jgi:hypothetical protein
VEKKQGSQKQESEGKPKPENQASLNGADFKGLAKCHSVEKQFGM